MYILKYIIVNQMRGQRTAEPRTSCGSKRSTKEMNKRKKKKIRETSVIITEREAREQSSGQGKRRGKKR